MKRYLGILTAAILLIGILSSCSSRSTGMWPATYPHAEASAAPSYALSYDMTEAYYDDETGAFNTEEYNVLKENSFSSVASYPVSTFSADVDTASYCNVRRMIKDGYSIGDIPAGAVRTEEMLNYFAYDYAEPRPGEPFGMTASVAACPWNAGSLLLVCGITTKDFDYEDISGCNYVFLSTPPAPWTAATSWGSSSNRFSASWIT